MVTAGDYRYKKPFLPGEIIDVEIRSPLVGVPDVSQLTFSHANGKVTPKRSRRSNRSGRRSKFPAARCQHPCALQSRAWMIFAIPSASSLSIPPSLPTSGAPGSARSRKRPRPCGRRSAACPSISSTRRYRPAGWTVRQVAHHVPDSHMNAYIRCKLALTEDNPTIRPYNETEWAKVADTARTPVEVSLALLESLHTPVGDPARLAR